jgi:hypothetical protein
MMNRDWIGNKNSIFKPLGATSHSQEAREQDDYYATDPIAIDKLLQVVELAKYCWEPACGQGHLSDRLIEHGKIVFSTDLKDRGYDKQDYTCDFLEADLPPFVEPFSIVTNPPYKYAEKFIKKSMNLLYDGELCCMLLKLTFLEGIAREELFKKYPPKAVYVFAKRLMCAKNGDFGKLKESGGSAVCFAWFVWQKGYIGDTVIKRIEQ